MQPKNETTVKHVTNRQGVRFSELARENSVPREDLKNFLDSQERTNKFFEELKNFGKFISNLFQKTVTISVPKNPDSFIVSQDSVMNFLEPVLKREKKLGNPDPWIDGDIWNWFKDKTVLGFAENFFVAIYRFAMKLTHQQILEEAEKTGIKKIYTLFEAFSIIRSVILSGEVDQKNTGIIVYFKVDNVLCRFDACRGGGGGLYVSVDEVGLGLGWRAGDGACFSN